MKKIVFSLLILIPICAASQVSYRFEQTTASYTNLSNAITINNPGFGSGDQYLVDLSGETFKYYNLPFAFDTVATYVLLQTNGSVSINNDSSSIIIDAAFIFLDSIDNNSELSYKIEGTTGNKIVKMQWKNLRIRTGAADNFINVQCWLYQATGVVELHYGPSSASNASGYTESGTKVGPQVGMFYAPNTFTKVYEKLWLNNMPSAIVVDSTAQFIFRALKGVPPNGAVYRFVPRFNMLSARLPGKTVLPVYPNPAQNYIILPFETSGFITDITGRQVMAFENTIQPDITALNCGIYFINTADGNRAKFIKQY